MKSEKCLLLIFDGMGDRPVKELGGKTPLEAASTPNLDAMAKEGVNGIMDSIAPGVRPGSDTSHLAFLGYDPYEYYTGRGPFEAAGIGLEVRPGDVAFRCNFATVDDQMRVIDRRAGRIEEGTHELAKALDGLEIDGVKVIFKESVAHRGALVLRGEGLGHRVSDVDPHEPGLPVHRAHGDDPASERTADVVNKLVEMSHEIFESHPVNLERKKKGLLPANILLPRGVGIMKKIPSFEERWGLKGAAIAEVGLIYGVAKAIGLKTIEVDGSTGGLDTDTEAMGRAALSALEDYEFVMMNVKGCDIAGHDGNARAKVEMIEKIDSMVGLISRELDDETYVVLTADHSTPVSVMNHSADPVPLCIYGPGVRTDDVSVYGERSCSRGGLTRIRGLDLMNIVLDLMDRAEKFGA